MNRLIQGALLCGAMLLPAAALAQSESPSEPRARSHHRSHDDGERRHRSHRHRDASGDATADGGERRHRSRRHSSDEARADDAVRAHRSHRHRDSSGELRAGDDSRERRHRRRRERGSVNRAELALRAPDVVPQDLSDMVGALRRMRVDAVRAPRNDADRSARAAGTQVWFVLPGCRSTTPATAEAACPVDRVEVEAVGGTGAVLLDPRFDVAAEGDGPRVRAFTIRGAPVVRVQLVGPANEVRLESVVDGGRFAELPVFAAR